MLQRFAFLCVVIPSLSFASGLSFGENGAKALSLGGAFAGQADDLTAVQHNPAGLALQPGTGFLLDVQLINQEVSLQRDVPNSELATNTGGPFVLPFAGASHQVSLLGR